MSFLSREVSEALSPAPEGALVIAPSGARAALLDAGYAVIESSVPKYDLARAFHAVIKETPEPGIHPSAVIEGPVKLGEGVIIGPGCVLQGRVEVGDGCRLGAHVCLLNDVTLGKEVRILNGALIGEDANSFGFGPGGSCFRFPSSGGVRIGEGVEIGNNAVIVRGVSGDTVLEEYSKIYDFAHLGNTVSVGRHSTVTGHCDISGRVTIGEGCYIAQSAAIRQGITIGDGTLVGMGAVVVDDVPAGVVVMGVPARVKRKR